MNLHPMKFDIAGLAHDAATAAAASAHDGRAAIVDTSRSIGHDIARAVSHAVLQIVSNQSVRTVRHAAAAASMGALVATISPDKTVRWVLRAIGLQRRPSAFARLAGGAGLMIAGVAVGAGVALLFAPATGAEIRRRLAGDPKPLRHPAVHADGAFDAKPHGVVDGAEAPEQVTVHTDDRATPTPMSAQDGAPVSARSTGHKSLYSPT